MLGHVFISTASSRHFLFHTRAITFLPLFLYLDDALHGGKYHVYHVLEEILDKNVYENIKTLLNERILWKLNY